MFPWSAQEGTSAGFYRVGVSVHAPHFPDSFHLLTFLHHSLLGLIYVLTNYPRNSINVKVKEDGLKKISVFVLHNWNFIQQPE